MKTITILVLVIGLALGLPGQGPSKNQLEPRDFALIDRAITPEERRRFSGLPISGTRFDTIYFGRDLDRGWGWWDNIVKKLRNGLTKESKR